MERVVLIHAFHRVSKVLLELARARHAGTVGLSLLANPASARFAEATVHGPLRIVDARRRTMDPRQAPELRKRRSPRRRKKQ